MLKRSKYGNKKKRLLKAISELEKALITDIEDPQIWYYLGKVWDYFACFYVGLRSLHGNLV